ncbi:MAG: NUDIX hydrolase [Anaerolineae bacterium]|nr:NUDIX hydrolase [Anaerolineae bacterium]
MNREYPERPLVGVGAVVVREDNAVLLVRREHPPRAGEWALPGGLVELGESLGDAVRREVGEECGFQIEVGPLVGVFQPIERDTTGRVRFHYVVLDYLAWPVGGSLHAASDAVEAAWALPEELSEYGLRPETAAMIEQALAMTRVGETKRTSW